MRYQTGILVAAAALAAAMVAAAPAALAQQLQQTSGDWRVFTYGNGATKQCYIASVPVKKTGNYSQRGEPFVMVTHRGAQTDEVSVSSGYPYKENSKAAVTVDSRRYDLFTQNDRGWAYDAEQDGNLINAMTKGNQLTVRGDSQRGTYSSDTYSLTGFTAARQKMKALCK